MKWNRFRSECEMFYSRPLNDFLRKKASSSKTAFAANGIESIDAFRRNEMMNESVLHWNWCPSAALSRCQSIILSLRIVEKRLITVQSSRVFDQNEIQNDVAFSFDKLSKESSNEFNHFLWQEVKSSPMFCSFKSDCSLEFQRMPSDFLWEKSHDHE